MPVLVKLKKTREAKGLSQNELARKTGYSLQNIQKIEQGRAASITFDALGRFCEVLECQPGDILEWQPDNVDDKTHNSSDEIVLSTASEQVTRKSDVPKSTKSQAHMVVIDNNRGAA
ncbi:helix-turn-helix transcriptional regulator [Nostocaceae cyanobacterium CENA369]|uniref:Helix-turn-helix transcriptional regulator n=1 Tax=Dendronalium phyllosphericum CENA369 TaxID=1725256 RepID=A0A8J7LGH9_9NOST|nr:helix-turn-helix transcriptional regulator [Dendronalium phyllosphericum]MBH8574924.1 helix-turn-helix transcriptional regulator [Dendronalium phyllosphericum CENA369]